MLSFTDLKEGAAYIGLPATVVIGVVVALHMGTIPSATSKTYEGITLLSKDVTSQQTVVELIIRQHGEQMELLMQGMREICFNTAKTQDRERACGNLQHNLSGKP